MDFNSDTFIKKIFDSKIINFDELALQLFTHQYKHNAVFQKYILGAGIKREIKQISDLPFLPVELFKTHEVTCGTFDAETRFTSSGTTGMNASTHFVKTVSVYESSYQKAFQLFYGDVKNYCILALLPSYLEREGSSLVFMFNGLIKNTAHPLSGFYLDEFEKLFDILIQLRAQKQKTILAGVTFALLDFAENFQVDFPGLILMETGGMKGRRKEMIREEMHQVLQHSFSVSSIHSEYGMTELLSKAYSKGGGKFACPPWMKIVITDANDPFELLPDNKAGIINVIDLANIHSCAFIKTADIGRKFADGTFEVLGRLDNSDLRGCSLLYL